MKHLPIETILYENEIGLRQQLVVGDAQDYVEIQLTRDQAVQFAKELLAFAGPKKSAGDSGTAEHFDSFWAAYPAHRRNAKQQMLKAWKTRKLDNEIGKIMSHIQSMKSGDWARDEGRFVPNASTYINQSRWEAEVTETGNSIESIVFA